jgi:hypothetical protein
VIDGIERACDAQRVERVVITTAAFLFFTLATLTLFFVHFESSK